MGMKDFHRKAFRGEDGKKNKNLLDISLIQESTIGPGIRTFDISVCWQESLLTLAPVPLAHLYKPRSF